VQVSAEDAAQHPERARIALMVASAHHARCRHGDVRRFAGLARRWGCSDSLIARVLLAGIHNTLACAVAIGGRHRERAFHHFGEAVAPAIAGGAQWLATQDRIRHQLEHLRLSAEAPALLGALAAKHAAPPSIATPWRDLSESLRKQGESAVGKHKEQIEQLAQLRKSLDANMKREIANAVKQLEAFANLQGYFTGGDLLPELHGWPISSDFAVLLVRLLEAADYDAVVELGSGSSTVLIARTLRRVAARTGRRTPARHIAFDHDEKYRNKCAALLQAAGLADSVSLMLAPLTPFVCDDGKEYPFYGRADAVDVTGLAATLGRPPRALVVVDGPPAATAPRARYPALEFCLPALAAADVTMVLDDYNRDDERTIARMWTEYLDARGIRHEREELPLEKGALLLRIPKP
jgi:hypothetical protein